MITPEQYNQREIDRGNLTIRHVTELVRVFQESAELELLVDGRFGPNTVAALVSARHMQPAPAADRPGEAIMLGALSLNLAEIGQGETHGNNRGPRIDFYRETDGTGIGPGGSGAWCATLQSSSLVRSAGDLDLELACRTSRGAKNLGDYVGQAGRFLSIPEVGCFVVWHRGIGRQGHIGQCVSYDLATDTLVCVEGNKLEPRPRRSRWATVAEHTYPNGLWRPKLYCLSTLAEAPRKAINE